MYILKQLLYLISFILILTGCTQPNIVKTPKIQNKPIVKTVKIEEVKKCKKYKKTMNEAIDYVSREFQEGYFSKKDIIGAKAQLFLVNTKSKTIFAKNINAAEKSFNQQYKKAKKIKCNLKSFKTSPIDKVKNMLKKLEKENI